MKINQPKTFEDYLQEVHGEIFPMLLDDDMSDHFDDWLGTLDGEEYIKYAEAFVVSVRQQIKNAVQTLPTLYGMPTANVGVEDVLIVIDDPRKAKDL